MAKDELKNLLEESKSELGEDRKAFEKAIRDDLQSFKKKTLGKI